MKPTRLALPGLILLFAPMAATAQSFTNNYGVWYYTATNGIATITGYTGFGGALTIPSVINGLPVASIGDQAFASHYLVTGVTIPSGVTSIGAQAFYECPVLARITMGNGVVSIGVDAFENCSSLTSITIPDSVTNIGDGAFENCGSLAGVTIPDSVTDIEEQVFSGCSALTGVTIPNSVTNIGDGAFSGCWRLTSVYFQGNAPSADSSAFSGEDNTTVYHLPGTTGWGSTFAGLPTAVWNLPARLSLTRVNGMAALLIEGLPETEYTLEYTTNLSTTNWSNVITLVLQGSSYTFIDATSLDAPVRFYRALPGLVEGASLAPMVGRGRPE
jgi:hypothetical protein